MNKLDPKPLFLMEDHTILPDFATLRYLGVEFTQQGIVTVAMAILSKLVLSFESSYGIYEKIDYKVFINAFLSWFAVYKESHILFNFDIPERFIVNVQCYPSNEIIRVFHAQFHAGDFKKGFQNDGNYISTNAFTYRYNESIPITMEG